MRRRSARRALWNRKLSGGGLVNGMPVGGLRRVGALVGKTFMLGQGGSVGEIDSASLAAEDIMER